MDTLHTVLRSIRGETKARRDHLNVFREFLDHLDRASAAQEPAAFDQGGEGEGEGAAASKRNHCISVVVPARSARHPPRKGER